MNDACCVLVEILCLYCEGFINSNPSTPIRNFKCPLRSTPVYEIRSYAWDWNSRFVSISRRSQFQAACLLRINPSTAIKIIWIRAWHCSNTDKWKILEVARQTRKIGPALAQSRVRWPNIVPYMGIHWANFPGLSGDVTYDFHYFFY